MRNSDISRLIAATGSDASGGSGRRKYAHDLLHVGGGGLIQRGQSLPKYSLQTVNGIPDAALVSWSLRRLALWQIPAPS
jgi:hypothetical protein